jgi:competence protein ComEC
VKADVLVVGHHGSKTSSRKPFIEVVSPSVSVISSGPKKYSGTQLPDPGIVGLLQNQSTFFRTDRDDSACTASAQKIGTDSDGKPGGCDYVVIAFSDAEPIFAQYWTTED